MPDVEIVNDHGMFVFIINTDEAARWVAKNVEVADWNTVGAHGFACEHFEDLKLEYK